MAATRAQRPEVAGRHDAGVYDDGHLRVEHEHYYASCDGEEVRLRRREFQILSLLIRRPGAAVTSQDIWAAVWGESAAFELGTLKVHIHRTRRQLEKYGVRIRNRPGDGYWIETGPPESGAERGDDLPGGRRRRTHTGA